MLRSLTIVGKRFTQPRLLSTRAAADAESIVFPREREGNIYSVNWSLTEDGIIPVGDAFRNSRIALLSNRLGVKVENGKVNLTKPKYTGQYTVQESGDGVSHEDFSSIQTAQQSQLSSGADLFVEDAGLGASAEIRVGVRVVSDSPAVALIARTLLVSFK